LAIVDGTGFQIVPGYKGTDRTKLNQTGLLGVDEKNSNVVEAIAPLAPSISPKRISHVIG
jgi:hypothetical protein